VVGALAPTVVDSRVKGLHRVLFWLLYLNDVNKGGETEFYYYRRTPRQAGC
jgi:hypothetical protein